MILQQQKGSGLLVELKKLFAKVHGMAAHLAGVVIREMLLGILRHIRSTSSILYTLLGMPGGSDNKLPEGMPTH